MQRKVVRTTLGELIVALTDEVMPRMGDQSCAYKQVSEILRTLADCRRVRWESRRPKMPWRFKNLTRDEGQPRI